MTTRSWERLVKHEKELDETLVTQRNDTCVQTGMQDREHRRASELAAGTTVYRTHASNLLSWMSQWQPFAQCFRDINPMCSSGLCIRSRKYARSFVTQAGTMVCRHKKHAKKHWHEDSYMLCRCFYFILFLTCSTTFSCTAGAAALPIRVAKSPPRRRNYGKGGCVAFRRAEPASTKYHQRE